jgi:molecular chaperone GrpE (heat shock protein)
MSCQQCARACESLGAYFNPLLHEAIGTIESDVAETVKIVDAVSRGWRWGGELLRPARVRVAR